MTAIRLFGKALLFLAIFHLIPCYGENRQHHLYRYAFDAAERGPSHHQFIASRDDLP